MLPLIQLAGFLAELASDPVDSSLRFFGTKQRIGNAIQKTFPPICG
jgi:hypothetical protein